MADKRIIRLPTVIEITGLSRSTIYKRIFGKSISKTNILGWKSLGMGPRGNSRMGFSVYQGQP